MIIIYKAVEGVVVMSLSKELLESHSMENIEKKYIPEGSPYKIVGPDYIPPDRKHRDLWEWDDSIIPDGIGGKL